MTDFSLFDARPIVVAVAGPNGAGKSTFIVTQLARTGLRLINADVIAIELNIDAYVAAQIADGFRQTLVGHRESFIFETVFSDPVGHKLSFLQDAAQQGYTVVMCFIGLESADQSRERVAMRVSTGGHDVPNEKLRTRFPRTLKNLRAAVSRLPHVLVYDNSDTDFPFREVAVFDHGQLSQMSEPIPGWLRPILT